MKNSSEQVGWFLAEQLRKQNSRFIYFHIFIFPLLFAFVFTSVSAVLLMPAPHSVSEFIFFILPFIFVSLMGGSILNAILTATFAALFLNEGLQTNLVFHCNFFTYCFIHDKTVSMKRLLKMKEQAREKGFDTESINDFFNDFLDRFPDRPPTHAELNFHLQKILEQMVEDAERKRQEFQKNEKNKPS